MKRLRHPIQAIREPFGTAGLIVACVALIAALAGGAYAASGGLTAKQKKEVKKIAKAEAQKLQGTGPAGAQGPAGPAGAKGDKGDAGNAGAAGVTPTGTEFAGSKSGHCSEGGVEVKGGNTTFVCNGVQGAPGPFVSQVPSGKTLKGVWSFTDPKESIHGWVPISFAFPVVPAPTLVYVKPSGEFAYEVSPTGNINALFGEEAVEEKCPGTATAPEAIAGFACAYAAEENSKVSVEIGPPTGLAGPANLPTSFGFGLAFLTETGASNSEPGIAYGSWAVTAS